MDQERGATEPERKGDSGKVNRGRVDPSFGIPRLLLRRSLALGASLLVFPTLTATAAEPTLTYLYPVAGAPGETIVVTASGKLDPWPPRVWVDAPGVVFEAGKKRGQFAVAIAPDATPGPHLVRIFNDDGVSAPRCFIVAPVPEVREMETNDDFAKPQPITSLPATIGGRLDRAGDVDGFAVKLRKGDSLSAHLEAYVLGSAFDGLLRIVDQRGTLLGFNHDGRTLDPALTWQAPHDGEFVVQVMGFVYPATASVGLTGGEGCVYRLHLTTTMEGAEPRTEKEPNDTCDTAQILEIPSGTTGFIESAHDEDRFAFTAVKKRRYVLQLLAARTGSPLDAWMKIESTAGRELARSDDTEGTRDPQLEWSAPEDGRFIVAVGDLTHRGGPDYRYRLTIEEAQPAITATAAKHSVVVTAGQTAELKVTIKRIRGFEASMRLTAANLPCGVTAEEIEIPAKDGELLLKLTASPDAARASQPFSLILHNPATGASQPVIYRMTTAGEDNGVPQGYTQLLIPETERLWITVKPTTPSKEAAAPEPAPPSAR